MSVFSPVESGFGRFLLYPEQLRVKARLAESAGVYVPLDGRGLHSVPIMSNRGLHRLGDTK